MRLPLPATLFSSGPSHPTAVRRGWAAALTATVLGAGCLTYLPVAQATTASTQTTQDVQSPTALTPDQALAAAKDTGKAVDVPGANTPVSTLTANPDGTMTMVQNVAPVRKYVAGTWKELDASLHKNADGSLSPAVTSSTITLSGGGTTPMARMSTNGHDLAVHAPTTLPAPTIDGPTATYQGVLAGVDLEVTVNVQGGFSEALVVHDAQAAANPALATLTLPVQISDGMALTGDAAGNIAVQTPSGEPEFTAPAPLMWDSTPSTSPSVTDPTTGEKVDAHTGTPITSSAQTPGVHAKTASLKAKISDDAVALTPDQPMLTDDSTVYPVYIDPTWDPDPAGSKRNSWTYVNSYYDDGSYWKTSRLLEAGYNGWETPYFKSRAFLNVSVPSAIYGSTIISSSMKIAEEWAPSCESRSVELWRTGAISAKTVWNNQPAWLDKIDAVSTAHGYDGCPAAGINFDTTDIMQDASAGKWTNLTVGLRASTEDDKYGWKKFSDTIASFSTTYDHVPAKPTTLTTSPVTSCSGAITTVGDGSVSLYAKGSDADGDKVGVNFVVTNAATGATIATTGTATELTSGQIHNYVIPRAKLNATAAGAITKISWKVQATDYKFTSAWSKTCSFNFDPTRPGRPHINDPHGEIIAKKATFTIDPPETGTAPTSYTYQLNGAGPAPVAVVSGKATTVTVTVPRFTNVLSVTAISPGGNVGDSDVLPFNAAPADIDPDSDLTGDGIADLLTVGNANGLPSGLWVTQGQAGTGHTTGDGQLITTATNLAPQGAGLSLDAGNPTELDGTQVISGHFTGSGLQDVLVYFPSGIGAGGMSILSGNGDGSPIRSLDSDNSKHFIPGSLTDDNGDNPVQLANVGDTSHRGLAYPDLIATSGDATSGYYLDYYPNNNLHPSTGQYDYATQLDTPTPTGGTDWNNWTIATAQTATGTAMYLWNSTTHALYLWQNPSYDYGTGIFTPGTQYTVSANYNPGTGAQLRAADINGDGTVDLWATTTGPTATAYLVTGLSTTAPATLTAQPAQKLLTGAHVWPLSDSVDGVITTAADTSGTLNMTANAGVDGNDGDLFSPDVKLGGSGTLNTTGPALNTSTDFTVSAWVNPTGVNGSFLSQQGLHASGLALSVDKDGMWNAYMSQTDTDTAARDMITGRLAPLGMWTHIGVTYTAATGSFVLYTDGIDYKRIDHTTKFKATGQFHVGNQLYLSKQANQFNGQVAEVQVWNQALTPTQMAQQSGTPGYVMFQSDDTNYTSPMTWTTAHGKLTFNAGLLSVIETNNANLTKTYGTTGNPAAVLSMQIDGNAVIYPQAAHTSSTVLWSAKTSKHPNDVMFFQPDGNLVIYDADGTVLWETNTNN